MEQLTIKLDTEFISAIIDGLKKKRRKIASVSFISYLDNTVKNAKIELLNEIIAELKKIEPDGKNRSEH